MQHSTSSRIVTVLVTVLVVTGSFVFFPFGTGVVSAESVEITECTTIDQQGTYVLTEDIEGATPSAIACIKIQSSNVTLDGQGHTITNPGYGIDVQADFANPERLENVVIRDLTVDARERVIVSYNATTVLDGVEVRAQEDWAVAMQFGDLTVSNSSIHHAGGTGVRIFSGNVALVNSTVSSASGGLGVYLRNNPTTKTTVTVTETTVSGFDTGIQMDADQSLVVEGSEISARDVGITGAAREGFTGAVVRDTDITAGRWGVYFRGDDNVVTDSRVTGPVELGIVFEGDGNSAERNVVTGSTEFGIGVLGEGNVLRDNVVNATTGSGFGLFGETTVVRATVNPTVSFVGDGVTLSAATAPAVTPTGLLNVGGYADVTLVDGTPLTLAVNYTDADIAGVEESSLALYRYDGTSGAWVPLADGSVDAAGDAVSGTLAESGVVAAFGAPAVSAIDVEISVKPGEKPTPINPNARGVVPVAVLNTADFDPADVNVSTLRFGDSDDVTAGLGAVAVHTGHVEDVDGDGDLDLVVHFEMRDAGFDGDETVAVLVGETLDGTALTGEDEVVIVGQRR